MVAEMAARAGEPAVAAASLRWRGVRRLRPPAEPSEKLCRAPRVWRSDAAGGAAPGGGRLAGPAAGSSGWSLSMMAALASVHPATCASVKAAIALA